MRSVEAADSEVPGHRTGVKMGIPVQTAYLSNYNMYLVSLLWRRIARKIARGDNFNGGYEPDINQWVSLRYRPHVQRFHDCGPTETFGLFDWVIWNPMDNDYTRTHIKNPSTILCLNTRESVDDLLRLATFSSRPSIVFAGEDTKLSELIGRISSIGEKFSKIYYEAKDIESKTIKSFSMGFISYYLRDAVYENIHSAIQYSNETPKSSLVLAAWGERWKHLDDIIEDRILLGKVLDSHDFIERRAIPFDRYWQELAKHHFLLAPEGNGVQAPKLAEAWMVKTVPICTPNPTFSDLKAMGYPMILIDDWTELTRPNFDKWASYHKTIDWDRVRHMLTNDFLHDLIH